MAKMPDGTKKEWLHRLVRFLIFAVLYVLLLIFLPQLLVSDKLFTRQWFLPVMLGAGVVVWIIYDLAYLEAKRWMTARFGTLFHQH